MKEITKHITPFLLQTYDTDISRFDSAYLNKSIQKRLIDLNCNSTHSYAKLLEGNPEECRKFLDSLQNCYSEFFRNSLTFSVLERIVFPEIVLNNKNKKHNGIRLWSAACAKGQEAYSIAILLEELKKRNEEDFDYRLFASDLDENQVNEARNGQYRANELSNMNMKRVQRWFIKNPSVKRYKDEIYSVIPALKENVYFSTFDLLDKNLTSPPASIFGDFDLVFCSNLLFYYSTEYQNIILEKVCNCIKKGGYLITGEAERGILIRNNFKEVYPQSAIFKMN